MEKILNYINGELVPPVGESFFESIDPAIGQPHALVPDSDQEDVNNAAIAAQSAFNDWSVMSIVERGKVLNKIADLIDQNHDALAMAECVDNGKPLKLAKSVDIPRASANMRFYATAIQHFASESHHPDSQFLNYTKRQSIGVAGCISPWNLPLYLFTWKITPALAAGNAVVAKPSEITPYTAYLFSKICIEAGLPKGVLNIVHGYGAKVGQAIVEHANVPVISFTGGTVTGKRIASVAAPMFKKLSLELGGKNPNIIFADCDYDAALSTSVLSSFANQGQICLCGSRILVQKDIYEKFVLDFTAKVKQLTIGDPLKDDSRIGALVSKDHLEKVLSYVELAKQEGGKVVTGGKTVTLEGRCASGYFMEPTVITGLSMECRTNQEEIFGPVVTITPFEDEAEALQMANATKYGLAATIWTENLKRAHRVAAAVHSGIIWVNCWLVRDLRTPFGGMKQSGVGREGGWEALKFFTEAKNVCINTK